MHSIQQYQDFVLDFLNAQPKLREPKNLYEPIQYILGLGGKKIRPVLTLMSAEIFDADYSKALPAALAVEVFHNFSLMKLPKLFLGDGGSLLLGFIISFISIFL